MKFLTKGIVDTKDEQQTLIGLQPKHQWALYIFKGSIMYGLVAIVVSFIGFFMLRYTPEDLEQYVLYFSFGLILLSLIGILIGLLFKSLFLRKPPFDDWVYEISSSSLGTRVIFYTHNRLYIQFNRTLKKTDFDEFIIKMAERSEKYSYFIRRKFIDEGFIEVETTKKIDLPKLIEKDLSKDKVIPFIPLGVTINKETKKLEEIGWLVNTRFKVEGAIEQLPSVSTAIVGGTGAGKSVALATLFSHICKFHNDTQAIGIDLKKVEFGRYEGLKGFKGMAYDIHEAWEIIRAFQRIMINHYEFLQAHKENNIYNLKEDVEYYRLANGEEYQFDMIFQVTRDLMPKDNRKLRDAFEKIGRVKTIYTIKELYEGIKDGTIINPQIVERKGMNAYLDDTSIRKIEKRPYRQILSFIIVDELNELMDADYRYVDDIRDAFNSLARLGRAAGFHGIFALQNATGNGLSGTMKKNIQQYLVIGKMDYSTSTSLFDKDYTGLSKHEVGRGLINIGDEIQEVKIYYSKEEKVFEFDENSRWTYSNKIYLEQCKQRGIEPNLDGFIEQKVPERKEVIEDEDEDDDDFFMGSSKFGSSLREKLKEQEAKKETKQEVKQEEKKKVTIKIKR